MRILHIIDSMSPASGGAPFAIRQLIPHMRAVGVEGEVVCFDSPERETIPEDQFPIYRIGQRRGPWHYHPGFRVWLKQELQRFDACIIHGLWLYNGYASTKEILSLRKRQCSSRPLLFIMPHGMLDPWFQKASHRWMKAIRNRIWWELLEKRSIHHADGLLFTTEEERRLASLPFPGYRPRYEVVIGLGCDAPPVDHSAMKEAFEAACPSLKGRPYILFLGRIDAKKGISQLLQAWKELLNSNDMGMQAPLLVLAGPGWDSHYGQSTKHSIDEDPILASNVLTIGILTGDAKWGAIYGCEAFVLPSHQENFGVAVSEALACGRPVLIGRGVNIHTTVTDNKCGLVCNPDTSDIRRMLLEWMATDEDQRCQMRAAAIDAWQKYFQLRDTALRMIETISNIERADSFQHA